MQIEFTAETSRIWQLYFFFKNNLFFLDLKLASISLLLFSISQSLLLSQFFKIVKTPLWGDHTHPGLPVPLSHASWAIWAASPWLADLYVYISLWQQKTCFPRTPLLLSLVVRCSNFLDPVLPLSSFTPYFGRAHLPAVAQEKKNFFWDLCKSRDVFNSHVIRTASDRI